MKRIAFGVALVLILSGCAAKTAAPPSATELLIVPTVEPASPTPPATPPPAVSSPAPKAKPKIGAAVTATVKTAITGAVVIDRQTGDQVVSENADRQFHSGSLVKLLIAVDALRRHPKDSNTISRVTDMIRYSDDGIASSFWVREGGTSIVGRMAKLMGLLNTEPPTPSTQWGETLVTANDLTRVYDYILKQAAAGDRDVIVRAMASAAPKGSDGFNQSFGIMTAMDHWAVKQAWTNDDTSMSCHSTGLVGDGWRYTVIILTEYPRSTPWSSATSAVTAAAKNIRSILS
ncbi:hypothetical protein [Actinocrispum sp. NPDC049592]|uniref:hypothetical protein n=1 Tax=Actinocrispum sp. NPDC049592 TaxID=3154835 RepID=UPI003411F91E